MRLRELSLDPQVVQLLEGEGLDQLYPPQEDAIEAGVLDGKNLVLASPTASGKTLVAEVCILKHILEKNGKAIYLAPLRALASEKFKEFQKYSSIKKPSGEHLRVGISTGDYDSSDPWLGRYDIIISTNEKADSLLRHRAPWMNELSLVVADEIHLLTEHERGPTLEVVLTRLTEINPNIQVLALSATVRNAEEVGEWLHAGSVTTEWRPVPLKEGIYHEGQLQFKDGSSRIIPGGTKAPVLDIALDVLAAGGQALIFTETRRSAVEMGRKASVAVKPRLSKIEERSLNTIAERILSAGEKTRLGEALASEVASGAGFHHAGLTGVHRGIVESAFRDGRIKVLAATPTLAAGVNLPARTVVISSYERFEAGHGRYPISVLEYKQFCLPHNTNVTLHDGSLVPIGNLVKHHSKAMVLSVSNPHGMVEQPVTEGFERKANELVEISTSIGRKLAITPEHPILIRGTNGRPEWSPAAQIKPGDRVAYARDIVLPNGPVHWLDFLPPSNTYVVQPIAFLNRKSIPLRYRDVSRKLRIKLKTFKGYMGHRRNPSLRFVLSLAEFLGIGRETLASEIRSVKSRWGKPVRLPPTLDEDFMWLAGIIASDGHLKKSKSDRRGEYYHIRIFNKDERIIEKTVSILRKMGLSPRVTMRGGGNRTVEVGSNLLGPLISQFGIPFRDKSQRVFVPDFMLRFPRSLIGAFLAGVFDGDGSYSETKYPRGINTKVRAIVIATGSEKFAWGIHELLLRIGIVSTVATDARALTVTLNGRTTTFPNPVYRIIMRRIADIQTFRRWARSVKQIPNIEYSAYHNVNEHRDAEAKRPYAWVRVTDNVRKKLSRHTKVYNLSVADTETYIASNFIVHNCGRAGRPKYDKYGESVLIARNQDEADWLMENYVIAQPEKLWSKLAVEKILRPHVLSTVAAGYAKTEEGLYAFFGRTFYAHQYGPRLIKGKIGEVLKFLAGQEMVEMDGRELVATKFGKRVSELYIDPMSAVIIRDGLYNRAKKMTDFSLLHLISKTPDIAPRPRPRGSELDKLGVLAASHSDEFMGEVANQFEDPIAYDEFLSELKATLVLTDWVNEFTEDQILETRKVEPGDLLRLVQGTEWLVFAAQELGRLFGHKDLLAPMEMLRVRVAKGVKQELVKLVGLEGVGRVRARMLYNAGLKSIDDIKERSLTELTSIPTIGPSLAKRIKEQAGGLIKAEEWEKAKSTKSAESEQQQVVLTDYEDAE
ncbi:hypothetical protein AUH73_06680 [archaeon 13_1_40CM_4_53_4]|nr:MAG: hypothetical protein AUH73_06680 [archaeon 13_1_40CM_4_53_4]